MKDKYLLLDIDGVLVPACSWKAPKNLEDNFPAFIPEAVRLLNTITGQVKIILTTSHRNRFTLNEWEAIFQKRGLQVTIVGKIPGEDLDKHESLEYTIRTMGIYN